MVQIVGARLPAWERVDRARFRRFVYRTLDPVAGSSSDGPYVVVYLHTDVTDANRPGASWLWNAFEALPDAWQEQLAAFYVVHPAATLRGTLAMLPLWLFSPFASGSFAHKVVYLDRLDQLWPHVDAAELRVPTFVAEHDKELAEHRASRIAYALCGCGGISNCVRALTRRLLRCAAALMDYGIVGPPTRELASSMDAMAGMPAQGL